MADQPAGHQQRGGEDPAADHALAESRQQAGADDGQQQGGADRRWRPGRPWAGDDRHGTGRAQGWRLWHQPGQHLQYFLLQEGFGPALRRLGLPAPDNFYRVDCCASARPGALAAAAVRACTAARWPDAPAFRCRPSATPATGDCSSPGPAPPSGYRLVDRGNLAELMIMRALRAMDVSIPELARILEMRRWGLQRLGSQRQHCGPARVDQPAD